MWPFRSTVDQTELIKNYTEWVQFGNKDGGCEGGGFKDIEINSYTSRILKISIHYSSKLYGWLEYILSFYNWSIYSPTNCILPDPSYFVADLANN